MSELTLEAYLFFDGNCREAMEFYRDVFGGELSLTTHGETPGHDDAATADDVIFATLRGGHASLMASDRRGAEHGAGRIELSLGGTDEPLLRGLFEGLAAGGEVRMPLARQFWGDVFGSLVDRYGIGWMVNIGSGEAG